MRTFAELIDARDATETEWKRLSCLIVGCYRGRLGLTPDAVKTDPAYRGLKLAYEAAYQRLRKINSYLHKFHADEMRASRTA